MRDTTTFLEQIFEPRVQGKVVYLIGAGFSAATGIPVLSNFIPAGLDLLKREEKPDGDYIKKVERTLYEYLAAAEFLDKRLVNLEDVFCLVDVRAQSAQSAAAKKHCQDQANLLKQFVVKVLNSAWESHEKKWKSVISHSLRGCTVEAELSSTLPPVVPQSCRFVDDARPTDAVLRTDHHYNVCAYQAFISKVLCDNEGKRKKLGDRFTEDNANVIVSLNYDLVLERKLRQYAGQEASVYYGNDVVVNAEPSTMGLPAVSLIWPRRQRQRLPLPLFKIHGSVNWLTANHVKDTSTVEKVAEFWDPRDGSATNISRIPIIPPTWRKSSATNSVFAKLLGLALHHMRLAEKIVIIGYSLPKTDAYFRYLLAEALGTPVLPTIELWDIMPPEDLRKNVREVLGVRGANAAQVCSTRCKGFLEHVASNKQPDSL